MKKMLLMLGLLVIATAASAERMVLEVIELQHRLVRDVLPILQPVLAPGSTATGTSNQLIIRSTPENLAAIREIILALDTRIRQLRITVTQDVSAVVQAQTDALAGHPRTGDFTVGVPDLGPRSGAGVEVDAAQGSVSYRTNHTRSQGDSATTHFVLGMDGQPAFIVTGQQIPQPYVAATGSPYSGTVTSGIDYKQVSSGVYVTPRLQGDHVVLDVAPQLERIDAAGSGAITTDAAQTTVSGRLGEWIPLGGANVTRGGDDSELLARTRRHSDNSYSAWIKVEIAP